MACSAGSGLEKWKPCAERAAAVDEEAALGSVVTPSATVTIPSATPSSMIAVDHRGRLRVVGDAAQERLVDLQHSTGTSRRRNSEE